MYFSWPCGGPVPVLITIGSLLSTRWQVERDRDFTTCALIEVIEALRDFFATKPARSNLQASWINVCLQSFPSSTSCQDLTSPPGMSGRLSLSICESSYSTLGDIIVEHVILHPWSRNFSPSLLYLPLLSLLVDQ